MPESRFRKNEAELALIKPNICGFYNSSFELLSAIIEYLDSFADMIVIGEAESAVRNLES